MELVTCIESSDQAEVVIRGLNTIFSMLNKGKVDFNTPHRDEIKWLISIWTNPISSKDCKDKIVKVLISLIACLAYEA